MTLPGQLFLKHVDGGAIGPLTLRALEVLYDARVVDRTTPISADGEDFASIGEWGELFSHVEIVKDRLAKGEVLWADPETSGPASSAGAKPMLRTLLDLALQKAHGHLRLETNAGTVALTYKDGKIVVVDTTIPELALGQFLVDEKICDAKAIGQAKERAPMMGGDLGGALISLGLVQPHVYFEKLAAWAKATIGRCLVDSFREVSFEPNDVPNPPVPLGFDTYGILTDAVRTIPRDRLEAHLLDKRGCPVIISQVEGATIESMKLQPKELRVLNGVNGVRTFGAILEEMGGADDAALPVMRAIYFGTQCGFIVFGEDLQRKKDLQECEELSGLVDRMKKKNHFEVYGITAKATDDDVRTRYTEFAKKYHPDKLHPNATPELRDLRREIFTLISNAFEAIENEAKRLEYADQLDRGAVPSAGDMQKVQNTLHAETLFKKAEILVRMRKYEEAMEHLEEAMALNPQDKEFKIYAAYAGYLRLAKKGGDPQDAAELAIRKILEIMKTDANIASGYLFLGHLNKIAGKAEVAVRYYEKVLEYDEGNQEAAREVRLAGMRKDKKKKGLFRR